MNMPNPSRSLAFAAVVAMSLIATTYASRALEEIHVQGVDGRFPSGLPLDKTIYNNLYLTFGTASGAGAAVSPGERFLVATSQIGRATDACKTFTGLRFVYDSAGQYKKPIRCENTRKRRDGRTVTEKATGETETTFTREGNLWRLRGELKTIGRKFASDEQEPWTAVEEIDIEVAGNSCRILHYRFDRTTPAGTTTHRLDGNPRCVVR